MFESASRCYELGLAADQRRALRHRKELPVPVVSIGNLVAGGTGKTPLAIWLARHFHRCGGRPGILSRGYGRKSSAPARVILGDDFPVMVRHFGDEPVLMAMKVAPVPVWVGGNRWLAGRRALLEDGCDVLVLDDGFQHLRLKRSLDLVLIDARRFLGNGRLLPLGPLREPPQCLQRADAVILTRAHDAEAANLARERLASLIPGKPVFRTTFGIKAVRVGLTGPSVPVEVLAGKAAVAFAGIAQPRLFFESLKNLGIVLSECFTFPDHFLYRRRELSMLMEAVRRHRSLFLITTEKDMVRLPLSLQSVTLTVQLEMEWLPGPEAFLAFLRERMPLNAPAFPRSCPPNFDC